MAEKKVGGSSEVGGPTKSSRGAATIEGSSLRTWGGDSEEGRAGTPEQIFHAQRMETLGALTAGIAHDFSNLLSVILGVASGVRLQLRADNPLHYPIRLIEQSAERAAELARHLLGFARPPAPEGLRRAHPRSQVTAAVRVEDALERVANLVRWTFDSCIQLRTNWSNDLPGVEGELWSLEQAVLNLCMNAREAMPEGGTLTLSASRVSLAPESRSKAVGTRSLGSEEALEQAEDLGPHVPCPPGDYLQISVRDTGRGIDPQVMPRIFQPFFTTKEPGKGTGLGLTMVRRFAQTHGGFVRVESQLGQGTEVAILLPAVPAPTPAATPEPAVVGPTPATAGSASAGRGKPQPYAGRELWDGAPGPLQRYSGTILVVDDDPLVLAFLEEGLMKLGYRVAVAKDGASALEICALGRAEIRAVLLDVALPETRGFDLCRQLRTINPRLRVILSSGYSGSELAREALAAGAVDFLAKPYTLARLLVALEKTAPG